jgi:RNA polymerase sigma-70 factor (ECF subfamily)
MTESVAAGLCRLLIADYYSLKDRLARRFRSEDFASDVLHETWLRLGGAEAKPSLQNVRDPKAYLYRIALNVATDRQRSDKSWLARAEIEALYRSSFDELDPGRITEARQDIAALADAIDALPPRRRAVFLAARIERMPYKVIAARLGIAVSVVDRELKAALDHFGDLLERKAR